jgi:hypothetical protein
MTPVVTVCTTPARRGAQPFQVSTVHAHGWIATAVNNTLTNEVDANPALTRRAGSIG